MEKRRNAIVELINEKGNVSFAQVKKAFPNVSDMTLRTDLKALDDAKRIVRIHGGARSVQVVVGTDDFLNRRSIRHIEEKKMIAQKALELVRPNTTIFIDSGSTTTTMASLFPNQSNQIYTSGLSCVNELAKNDKMTVNLPGGRLNRYSLSVYGFDALRVLENVFFRQAFLGVTFYHPDTGFTCGNMDEAVMKQAAMRQSTEKIVLMDSSKYGIRGTFSICQLKDIDILVSDGNLPEEFLAECRQHNVQVL